MTVSGVGKTSHVFSPFFASFVLATAAGPISRRTTQAQTATIYSKRSSLSLRDENGRFDPSKAKLQAKRLTAKTTRMSNVAKNLQKNNLPNKLLDSQSSQNCGQNPQSVCLDALNEPGPVSLVGEISIGSPGQQFIEIFDTGSSDLIVPGLNCAACSLAQHFYDPTKSRTSVSLNQTLEESFGENLNSTIAGVTSFEQFTDTVTLGGLTIKDVTVSVLTQESGEFVSSTFDGVFGLGSPAESASGYNVNAVIKAWQQGLLPKPQFSLAMGPNESELFMGGQNPARFQGQTEFHPVVGKFGWIIGGGVMSTNIGVEFNRLFTVIDSGTSAIVAPADETAEFYSKIKGAKLVDEVDSTWTVPCSAIPDINISFSWNGGRNFSVNPEFLNFGQNGNDTENCVFGLQGFDTDLGVPGQKKNNWIIGDVVMQNFYTTFDFDQNLIGFSTLAN